ncbi:hypothetical protein [Dyadobacter sp. CY323]|uniref:hypothetical protein n=1 Tax=Dyadobacter sp. CY323 TaxID=2907302 RepID=UPI001F21184E|nr:hypothetical protein [Dyadobacter sp. CY323]MCE6991949.1 hypothetical protein [Dyadobacter sp. CY323]
MMKQLNPNILFFLAPLLLMLSCIEIGPDYLDEEANLVDFVIEAQVGDLYKEIRIYSKELKDGVLINADSTIFNALNKDGKNITFPKAKGLFWGLRQIALASLIVVLLKPSLSKRIMIS